MFAFRGQREVHHHDAVFLHDTDQQDDSDQGYYRQIVAASHQNQQSAYTRRRQRRQDGQWMDIALVQQTQHDVDGHQRGTDEVWLRAQRIAKGLRRALEAARQRRRHAHLGLRALDGIHGLSQRVAGREIEGNGHGRELSLVIDRKIAGACGVDRNEGG